jgi:hypothetical protein
MWRPDLKKYNAFLMSKTDEPAKKGDHAGLVFPLPTPISNAFQVCTFACYVMLCYIMLCYVMLCCLVLHLKGHHLGLVYPKPTPISNARRADVYAYACYVTFLNTCVLARGQDVQTG